MSMIPLLIITPPPPRILICFNTVLIFSDISIFYSVLYARIGIFIFFKEVRYGR
ncbi:hypothetical protein PilKf_00666 [Pillotina sp. SPG140]